MFFLFLFASALGSDIRDDLEDGFFDITSEFNVDDEEQFLGLLDPSTANVSPEVVVWEVLQANPSISTSALREALQKSEEGRGIESDEIFRLRAIALDRRRLPWCVYDNLRTGFSLWGTQYRPDLELLMRVCQLDRAPEDLDLWMRFVVSSADPPNLAHAGIVLMTDEQFRAFLGAKILRERNGTEV